MYVVTEAERDYINYNDVTEELVENGFIDKSDEEKFEIQMRNRHLPLIEETGYIDHDERSDTIHYIEDEELEMLLETLKTFED